MLPLGAFIVNQMSTSSDFAQTEQNHCPDYSEMVNFLCKTHLKCVANFALFLFCCFMNIGEFLVTKNFLKVFFGAIQE